MTKKGLLLDKVDFAVNGYEVDKQKYLWNPNKGASSNDKDKKKVDEVMDNDQSNKDMEEEKDVVTVDNNIVILE